MLARAQRLLGHCVRQTEIMVQGLLGSHWRGFTLGLVLIGTGMPAAVYLVRPILLPEQPAVAVAPGDTVVVYGPRQFNAASTKGTTYVERFTVALVPGRKYELKLVNGTPGGTTNRVTSAVTLLNGLPVVSKTELTTSIASVTKVVAVRQTDTLRITVAGVAGSFVTATVSSLATSEFAINGPTVYNIPTGSSKTYTFTFTKPATAAPPYRIYVYNGDSTGAGRVTQGSVKLNGTTVVTTSEIKTAVSSVTKPVNLLASNTVVLALKGSALRFVTLSFTATDTVAPAVTITSPPADSVVRTSPLTVTGTITDASPTTVTVNGVQAAVTNNTTWSASVPLSTQGNNTLTVIATDAGGKTKQVTRNVIFDSQGPVLVVNTPADNTATKNATVTVSGTASDATPVMVNTNGTPLPLTGTAFTGEVSLAYGPNVLTTTATDAGGNATSVVRNVIRDTVPPVLTVTAPAEGATTTEDSIAVSGTYTDETLVTVGANGILFPLDPGTFSGKAGVVEGPNTIVVVATDAAGNTSTVSRSVTRTTVGEEEPPPDPSTVAPPLSPAVASTIGSATSFLFTGPDAIQTGVAPGTITPTRVAVLRGKVMSQSGDALPGARISILDHPEFGQTLSRDDGRFDLAANGGGTLIVQYSKSGYLPSQRQVDLPWQDYVEMDSVAMLPLDPAVTTVNFTEPIEVARGTAVTDTSGTRRNTLMFESGTEVSVTLPNGSSQPLTGPIQVRSTEYTVGALGPAAMPAVLPPNSAYTYAVELSVDEAMAMGATDVRFSKPVASYVENFMNLPVGHAIPVGSYDRKQAKWIPEPDGRVIKIQSVTGGLANLVVDTTGNVATSAQLTSLGITEAERQTLATTYSVNQTLWRSEHTHFSPWDYNLIVWLLNEARHPGELLNKLLAPVDDPTICPGSIISCENQALGEALPLAGTPFSLHYQSDRVPGYKAESSIELQLSEATLPTNADLESLELSVNIAGQHFQASFSPTPNRYFTYSWDGLDVFGRVMQGTQRISVERCYKYKAVAITRVGSDLVTNSFGRSIAFPGGTPVAARPYSSSSLCTNWAGRLGAWYAPAQGFGGWSLSAAHSYDPAARTLYLGTGRAAAGRRNRQHPGDCRRHGSGRIERLWWPSHRRPGRRTEPGDRRSGW